jgi:hypothetical protein
MELGCRGMAQAIDIQRANSLYAEMSFEDRLSHLVLTEEEARGNRMRERLVKNARFKVNATPESLDFSDSRGLQRSLITELCTSNWIERGCGFR